MAFYRGLKVNFMRESVSMTEQKPTGVTGAFLTGASRNRQVVSGQESCCDSAFTHHRENPSEVSLVTNDEGQTGFIPTGTATPYFCGS